MSRYQTQTWYIVFTLRSKTKSNVNRRAVGKAGANCPDHWRPDIDLRDVVRTVWGEAQRTRCLQCQAWGQVPRTHVNPVWHMQRWTRDPVSHKMEEGIDIWDCPLTSTVIHSWLYPQNTVTYIHHCLRASIVIKPHDRKQLGEEFILDYSSTPQSFTKGSHVGRWVGTKRVQRKLVCL